MKIELVKPVISSQSRMLRQLNEKFIYRIFYKNAKKANPKCEICLYDIRKHKVYEFMSTFALSQRDEINVIFIDVGAIKGF